jgi:aspartate/methionine/tyrosine aminotransferase
MAARPEALDPLRTQKQLNSICTTTPSQYAALAAADVYASVHDEQVNRLAQIRSGAVQQVTHAGGNVIPGGAVSVLAVSANGRASIAERLSRSGFTFADGAAFGAEGVVRLAVTPDAAIARAVSTL